MSAGLRSPDSTVQTLPCTRGDLDFVRSDGDSQPVGSAPAADCYGEVAAVGNYGGSFDSRSGSRKLLPPAESSAGASRCNG